MRAWTVGHAKSIALVVAAMAIALTLTYPLLFYLDRYSGPGTFGESGLTELVNLSTAIAAALIISRQPRNTIGWMLAFVGLAGLLTSAAQDYSVLANIVHHKTLPGGTFSAWLGSWLFLPGITLLVTMVLLLFPDGHLPSRRWRPVAWLSTATVVVATVGLAVGAIPKSANFAVDSGGGSLTGGSPSTNVNGLAAVGSWKLGVVAGNNTMTATAAGLSGSPLTFTATGQADVPAQLVLNDGDGQ